jgi:hypothetical protein
MTTIYIARGQNQLGKFSPQEVADGLQSGRFLPSDLAWSEGMSSWVKLADFSGLPRATGEAVSPPLQQGFPYALEPLPVDPLATMDGDRSGLEPAWEKRETKGFVSALVETIGQVLTRPGHTFSRMPREAGYFAPLLFTILTTWVGNAAAIIYQLIYSSMNPEELAQELEGVSVEELRLYLIGAIIVMPVIILFMTFISAFFTHFFLWLFGGVKHPYMTTFRVVAYTQGSTSILQLIPMCGGFIYPFWYLFSTAVGLAKAQETEVWRAVLALLFPLILCCGLILGALIFAVGASTP